MKMLNVLSTTYHGVPPLVKSFLTRALIIFVVWKLLYHLVLYPTRFPDRQLTNYTAATTDFLYTNLLSEPRVFYRESSNPELRNSTLYVQDNRAIGIADSCNGLELYVLYVGFLFCISTTWKRQILFVLAGIAGIFILNGFRCFGLAWLFLHNYSFANFAHHYLFKIIIYSCIFYTWVLYSRKYLRGV